jgi:hypothetical protein
MNERAQVEHEFDIDIDNSPSFSEFGNFANHTKFPGACQGFSQC